MNTKTLHALAFAAHQHRDQRRKDIAGTPYINHPIDLVFLLSIECGISDINIICCALLHDTIEDTDATYESLSWTFGPEIANLVQEMTDDKELDKHVRKQLQIDHAAKASHDAKIVKLADKIVNLRDLINELPQGWTNDRRLEYFEWAKDVVDELRGTHAQLENLFDEVYDHRLSLPTGGVNEK